MRQLYPTPAEQVDVLAASRPLDVSAPLSRLNFVTSVDGCVVDAQRRSGGFSGPGDRRLFHALRAWADVILVGANTFRAEPYQRPYSPPAELVTARRDAGRTRPAAFAIVSRRLELDLHADLFNSGNPVIVVTCEAAPAERRAAAGRAAHVMVAGQGRVELDEALDQLRAAGLASVLCEGGPTLASGLLAQGLVDEVFCTYAPLLAGLGGPHLAAALPEAIRLRLRTLLHDQDALLARYDLLGR